MLYAVRPGTLIGKMRHILWSESGMATIEVTVLIPILSWIICMVFLFMLFLIDMSSSKSESMRIAVEIAHTLKNGGDLKDGTFDPERLLSSAEPPDTLSEQEEKGADRLNRRLADRLYLSRPAGSEIQVTPERIRVKVRIHCPLVLPGYTGGGRWTFETSAVRAPEAMAKELRRLEWNEVEE